jgi:hypothetical protein
MSPPVITKHTQKLSILHSNIIPHKILAAESIVQYKQNISVTRLI